MAGIESLCDHLPGQAGKLCKDEVEKMLPMAINFMTAVVVRHARFIIRILQN